MVFLDTDSGRLPIQASAYFYETRRQAEAAKVPAEATDMTLYYEQLTINQEFVDKAQNAIENYKASTDGQDLIAKAREMSQPEIIAALEKMIQDKVFNEVAEMAQNGAVLSDGSNKHVNSLYVSVALQLAAGFGVAGSVTYAIDPNNRLTSNNYYTISFAGTLAVGPEIEAEITLEVGAAAASPDDMGGLGAGGSLSVAYGLGVSGTIMFGVTNIGTQLVLDVTNWSIGVGPATGVGIGWNVLLSYGIVALDRQIPPIAQPATPHQIMLTEIYCDQIYDGLGSDELRLGFNLNKQPDPTWTYPIWGSYAIEEGDTWKPGLVLNVSDYLSLSLSDVVSDDGNHVETDQIVNIQIAFSESSEGNLIVENKKSDDGHITVDTINYDFLTNLKIGEQFLVTYHDTVGIFNEVFYKLTFQRVG